MTSLEIPMIDTMMLTLNHHFVAIGDDKPAMLVKSPVSSTLFSHQFSYHFIIARMFLFVCLLVGWLVGRSVGWLLLLSFCLVVVGCCFLNSTMCSIPQPLQEGLPKRERCLAQRPARATRRGRAKYGF